uniref:Uncharacterized protein n=1 Tax=Arundo donax TaxID=35708 RepID=A0A0A9G3D2_ARUDO
MFRCGANLFPIHRRIHLTGAP